MVKDRLLELKKAQNSNAVTVESTDETGVGTDLKKVFERGTVIQQWTEQIENNLEQVSVYLRQFEDLNYKQKDVVDRLNSLFQNNLSISKQISSKLKEIELEIKNNEGNSAQSRIIQIQYQTASARFKKVFIKNNEQLENFKTLQKQQIRGQLLAKNVTVTDEELTSLLDEGKDIQVFTENIIQETAEAKRILRDVEERHQQLLKIESMLMEVHDLFLQLAILVETQQELVDRIEYQANIATSAIIGGKKQLKSANKKKQKNRKCCLIIGAIVTVTVVILIIILIKS